MKRSRCAEHGGVCACRVCPPHRGIVILAPLEVLRNASRAQSEGPHQVRRGTSAAQDSIEAGIIHLASLQRGSLILREDCYNVVTRAPAVGNDLLVPDSKRERSASSLCSSGYWQRWRW